MNFDTFHRCWAAYVPPLVTYYAWFSSNDNALILPQTADFNTALKQLLGNLFFMFDRNMDQKVCDSADLAPTDSCAQVDASEFASGLQLLTKSPAQSKLAVAFMVRSSLSSPPPHNVCRRSADGQ